MTQKLIIHAGFPKTGTTSLQASLASAREDLLKQGIHYPKRHGSAQHDAAWALTERVYGWEGRGGAKTPIAAWESLVQEVSTTKETVLLSSEFLSHAKPSQVERMKSDLNVADTTIIFTLRAIAKILPSRYQQSLKKGNTWGYHEWLRNVLHLEGATSETRIKFGNYSKILRRWCTVFGSENVVLVVVDETSPNLIFDAFHDLLNLNPSTLKKVEDKGLNRSLTWPESVLLTSLNNRFEHEGSWNDYVNMVRNSVVKSWSGTPAPKEYERILTPQWAVNSAVAIARENIQEIDTLGIRIIGELQLLASESVPTGDNASADSIPVKLATESLFAQHRKYQKRIKAERTSSLTRILRTLKLRKS